MSGELRLNDRDGDDSSGSEDLHDRPSSFRRKGSGNDNSQRSTSQRGLSKGNKKLENSSPPSTPRSQKGSDGVNPLRRKASRGPLEQSHASPTPFSSTRRRSRMPDSHSTDRPRALQTPKIQKQVYEGNSDSPSAEHPGSPPTKGLSRKKSRAPSTASPKGSPEGGTKASTRTTVSFSGTTPNPRMNRRSIAKMAIAQLPVERDLDDTSSSEEDESERNGAEDAAAEERASEAQEYAARLGLNEAKTGSYFDKIDELKVKQAGEAEKLEEENQSNKKKKKGFMSLLRSPMGKKKSKKLSKAGEADEPKQEVGNDIYNIPLDKLGEMLVPKDKPALDMPQASHKSGRAGARSIDDDVEHSPTQEHRNVPDSKKTSLSDIRRMMEKSKTKSLENVTGAQKGSSESVDSSEDFQPREPLVADHHTPVRRSGRRSTVASPEAMDSRRSKSPTYNHVVHERRSTRSPGSNNAKVLERREARRSNRDEPSSRSKSPTGTPRALERRESRRINKEDRVRSKSPSANPYVLERRESRRVSSEEKATKKHSSTSHRSNDKRESRSYGAGSRSKSPTVNHRVFEKREESGSDSPGALRRNQRRSVMPPESPENKRGSRKVRSEDKRSKKEKIETENGLDADEEPSGERRTSGHVEKRKPVKARPMPPEEQEMSWVRRPGPARKSLPTMSSTTNSTEQEGSSSGRRRRASEMPNSSNRSRRSAGTPSSTSHSREGVLDDPKHESVSADEVGSKGASVEPENDTEGDGSKKNIFVSRRSRPSHSRRPRTSKIDHHKKGPRTSKKDDASNRDSLKESPGIESQIVEEDFEGIAGASTSALPIDDLESAFARAKMTPADGEDADEVVDEEESMKPDVISSSEEEAAESVAINPVPHLPPTIPQESPTSSRPPRSASESKQSRPTPPKPPRGSNPGIKPPRPDAANSDSSGALSLAEAFDRAKKKALAAGPRPAGSDGDSVFTSQTEESADMYYRGNGSIQYVQPAENVDAAQLAIDDMG